MIRCEWKEDELTQLEKWPHVIVWPLAIGSGIYLLKNRSFEPSSMGCWIVECGNNPVCRIENQGSMLIKSGIRVLGLFYLFISVYVMCAVSKFARQSNSAVYTLARRRLCYAGAIIILQVPNLLIMAISLLYDVGSIRNLSTTTFALAGCFNNA